jgi:hypothetical protein
LASGQLFELLCGWLGDCAGNCVKVASIECLLHCVKNTQSDQVLAAVLGSKIVEVIGQQIMDWDDFIILDEIMIVIEAIIHLGGVWGARQDLEERVVMALESAQLFDGLQEIADNGDLPDETREHAAVLVSRRPELHEMMMERKMEHEREKLEENAEIRRRCNLSESDDYDDGSQFCDTSILYNNGDY